MRKEMNQIKQFIIMVLFPVYFVYAQDTNIDFFQQGAIKAIGISAEGQSKYAAITSAEIIAQRNLIEKIKGVSLSSVTQMKNSKITSDIIQTRVQGLIVGAISCGKKYDEKKGFAEVCLQMPMHGRGGVFDVVYPAIQEFVPKTKPFQSHKAVTSSGKRSFDGLIVDVSHYTSFQPAIVNRILDRYGRVVYEPSMISHQLMMETGPVQFATSKGKAEAILADLGAKNPLFIRSENIQSGTDVVISDNDAENIYAHNQQSNMLHRARVVFLLK